MSVFRGYYYTACIAVDTVGEGGTEAVFVLRPVFALVIQIVLYSRYQGVTVFVFIRVDKKTLLFVCKKYVFVFINDIEFCGGGEKIVLRLYRYKKLVVYIGFHCVALFKAGAYFRAPAVYLYSLGSYVFEHKR